ncbi:unnamed protein product, partial [marine sediment metagenome]
MSIRETHRSDGDGFIPGDWWLVCDVCGFDYRSSDMKERWDHAMVCTECWEKRNEQEGVRGIAEKIAVPIARPVPDDNNLIKSWTNSTYETFETTDSQITEAVNSAGNGSARSNDTTVASGTNYSISSTLTLNSGQAPTLITGSSGSADGTTLGTLSNGPNTINFEADSSTYLYITNTADSDYS